MSSASVAIGSNTMAKNDYEVALGAGSKTEDPVATAGITINGVRHEFAGTDPHSTVSVGYLNAERTITNVAAGRITETSTDAVNGSQLHGVIEEINKGVVYAGDVKTAAAPKNDFKQKLGAQTTIKGGVTDVNALTDDNIGVVSNGKDTLTVKLKKNLDLGATGSVKMGNTLVNKDGMTITGGPKVLKSGIDAGSKQIKNVQSGGTVTTNAANIGDVQQAVNNAKVEIDQTLTAKGLKFEGNDGQVVHRNLGTKLTVKGGLSNVATGVSSKNLGVKKSADGNGLELVMSETPEFKSVTITNAPTEENHVTNKKYVDGGRTTVRSSDESILVSDTPNNNGHHYDVKVDYNKVAANTPLTYKANGANAKTVKLAEGLDFVDTENITASVDANGVVKHTLKNNLDLGPNGSVKMGDTLIHKDGMTITGGPTITKTNVDMGGQVIHHVGEGVEQTDAVNVSQLNKKIAGATTKLEDGKNTTVGSSVDNVTGATTYHVDLKDNITLGSDADKQINIDGTTGNVGIGDRIVMSGTTGNIITGKIKLNGQAGTVNELTNRDWNVDNPTPVSGQAATEDQLKRVNDRANQNKQDITTINQTLAKGLNFKGDDAVINKKLGERLDILGGADKAQLSEDNIGVIFDHDALRVKLAKNLRGLTSVTTGDTVMNDNGVTIGANGPSITKTGINAGNKRITNVEEGVNETDGVNVKQLKETVAKAATKVEAADNNVSVEKSVDNTTGAATYKVGLKPKVELGTEAGKKIVMDGTNGTMSVGDKISMDGTKGVLKAGDVTINGDKGTVNGLSNRTWNPDNYVSGQAATEDQLKQVDNKITNVSKDLTKKGLDFAGDSGEVHRDLGQKVTIKGEGTKSDDHYSGENIKTMADANGNLTISILFFASGF